MANIFLVVVLVVFLELIVIIHLLNKYFKLKRKSILPNALYRFRYYGRNECKDTFFRVIKIDKSYVYGYTANKYGASKYRKSQDGILEEEKYGLGYFQTYYKLIEEYITY